MQWRVNDRHKVADVSIDAVDGKINLLLLS